VKNSTQYIGDVAGHEPIAQFVAPSTRLSGARWIHPAMEVEEVAPPTHVLMLHCGGSVRVERFLEGQQVATRSKIGTVGLMSALSHNRWIIGAPTEVLHLYVPTEVLPVNESTGMGIEMEDCFARDDPWLVHLMMMIFNEVLVRPFNSELLLLDELERALASHLTRQYGVRKPYIGNYPRLNVGGLSVRAMRQVICALEEQSERNWRLSELAAIASLSADHLIRAFKQSVGTTPHRYLMRVRLNRALGILQKERDLRISDIAKQCGFSSESHFATSFKTAFGMRPSDVGRGHVAKPSFTPP
jgi:AraC family transcriptional regulator